MSNLTVEEGNKLKNWCDVLIVERKYSKVQNESTTFRLFLSYYMGVNNFLLYYIYLCISLETPVIWLGLFLIFGQELKWGVTKISCYYQIFQIKIRLRSGTSWCFCSFCNFEVLALFFIQILNVYPKEVKKMKPWVIYSLRVILMHYHRCITIYILYICLYVYIQTYIYTYIYIYIYIFTKKKDEMKKL